MENERLYPQHGDAAELLLVSVKGIVRSQDLLRRTPR